MLKKFAEKIGYEWCIYDPRPKLDFALLNILSAIEKSLSFTCKLVFCCCFFMRQIAIIMVFASINAILCGSR